MRPEVAGARIRDACRTGPPVEISTLLLLLLLLEGVVRCAVTDCAVPLAPLAIDRSVPCLPTVSPEEAKTAWQHPSRHAASSSIHYVRVQQRLAALVFCRSRRLLRSGKGPPAPDRHKNLIALVGEGRHWQRRRSCATCKGLGLCKMSTRSPSSRGVPRCPRHLRPLRSNAACTQYTASNTHRNECRSTRHHTHIVQRPRRRRRPRSLGGLRRPFCSIPDFGCKNGFTQVAVAGAFSLSQTIAIRIWAQPNSHRLVADRLATHTFRGDLYMAADTCTHIPASKVGCTHTRHVAPGPAGCCSRLPFFAGSCVHGWLI